MNNEYYWEDIPIGKDNAISYSALCDSWGKNKRSVRMILHELSRYDNGDNYVLIRSSKSGGGFYKTDNIHDIKSYRKECMSKAKSNFAPLKKINRIIRNDTAVLQSNFYNNLKAVRLELGLKQSQVVEVMRQHDIHFDISMLSKFENSYCMPTPYQLSCLANIYNTDTKELIMIEHDTLSIYA